MSSPPLSSLLPSFCIIANLNYQFQHLAMSSDRPNTAVEARPPAFSSTNVPLPPGTRMALIKVLETFRSAVVNVPDSGHLTILYLKLRLCPVDANFTFPSCLVLVQQV